MVTIHIRHLTKNFGPMVALDNINLTIQSGEMFFLLGPSGCGKTTLLRHIAGFYTPDKGHLLFDDKDITHLPAHLRNTAMMFQSYALWPHLTVGENVAFGLIERKLPKPDIETRVQESLQMVKMGHLADRKINQLSGGQQQRVALARSLAVRPDALLLDEPLSNLDAKLRLEMRSEIRRICKEFGVTAVYVTHDQKEALHLADRMAIMEKGLISQIGTPRQIFRSPLTASVASFIGEANFLPGTLIAPSTSSPAPTASSSPTPTSSPTSISSASNRSSTVSPSSSTTYATAHTTHGIFTGRLTDPTWHPTSGEKIQLCLRPEALRLTTTPAPANLITGHLTESIYLGELAQYTVRDPGGNLFHLSELNPTHLRPADDSQVTLTIHPDDVLILRP